MKQRITYLVPDADSFNPEQIKVQDGSFTLDNVKAAKEHRMTLGLSELPAELRKAFEQWHELHIRWASPRPYTAIPPFTSRVSPGLHVLYTPHKDGRIDGGLCNLLKDTFSDTLKCKTPNSTFTQLPILSSRFSMSSSSQYYSPVFDLSRSLLFILTRLCGEGPSACKDFAKTLLHAAYLDVDYDTISHAVIVNVFWDRAPNGGAWEETIRLPGAQETIEIGVLNNEKNPDPEDIAFAGFLTVLGQDSKPKPTRFQTPARHYPLSGSARLNYRSSFAEPTGLHPTLLLTLPRKGLEAPNPTCKLHTHLTLPSGIFIDKYQFTDALFLQSHNLKSLRSISGATDLEAPDWVVEQWGSAALFELAVPPSTSDTGEWQISIPLHLRYLPPSDTGHRSLAVPWPVLFWACRSEEGAKMAVNPFDRLHLGYERLFGDKTRFMHIPPSTQNASGLVNWIEVPVLNLEKSKWVETGTVSVVLIAFLGLCWALFGGSSKRELAIEKEKKKQ